VVYVCGRVVEFCAINDVKKILLLNKVSDKGLMSSYLESVIPVNRPWRSIGLWDVEAHAFSRQSARRWR
jgi:hypothetical protein